MKIASTLVLLTASFCTMAQRGLGSPIVITSNSSLGGAVNWGFSTTLSAAGGSGGYRWSATGLAPGLNISTTGVISGTVTVAGEWQSLITVSDTLSNSTTQNIMTSFQTGAPALSLTPVSPIPNAAQLNVPTILQVGKASSSPAGATVTLTLQGNDGNSSFYGFPSSNSLAATCDASSLSRRTISIDAFTEQPIFLCFTNSLAGDSNGFPRPGGPNVMAYIPMGASAKGYPSISAELPVQAQGSGFLAFASPLDISATGSGDLAVTVVNLFGSKDTLVDPVPNDPWIQISYPNTQCLNYVSCTVVISADASKIAGAQGGQTKIGSVTLGTAHTNSNLWVNYQYPGPPLTFTSSTVFGAAVSYPFVANLSATGGAGSYTWSSNDLPAGLQISNGVVSGIAGAPGIWQSNITVQDQANHAKTTLVTFAIAGIPDLQQITAGDFDGDGKADYAVWRPWTGTWWVIPSTNPSVPLEQQWGASGDIPVPGDFDGDGRADYAVWRPAYGIWYVIPSSNPLNTRARQWGTNGDIPVVGDFDGDGKTDYAVWRPANGTWYVIPSSDPLVPRVRQWGTNGDVPVAGDFDGDGKTDYAVWRPSNGTWYVIPSSNPSVTEEQQWGTSGDIPVAGDYDGDGKTDYAVWRPWTGTWYVIPSSNRLNPIEQQLGIVGDTPVAGRFDLDRKTDYAVWRPSNGTWYVISNGNFSAAAERQWGTFGDFPR